MEAQVGFRHILVLLAAGAGIVGMGTVFSGAMHGNPQTVLQGIPPLLLGLWWAGRELGRSMIVARMRKASRGGLHEQIEHSP
jgi:hypothetical protein